MNLTVIFKLHINLYLLKIDEKTPLTKFKFFFTPYKCMYFIKASKYKNQSNIKIYDQIYGRLQGKLA